MSVEGIVLPLEIQTDPSDPFQKNEEKEEKAGGSRKMFRFSREKHSYSKMLALNKEISEFEKRNRDFLIIKTYDDISKETSVLPEQA